MRNPLNKRWKRELKEDFGKYLVIFLFLAGTIALVSGFLVASDSMIYSYDESFEKYQIEDGNFELSEKADQSLIDSLEKEAAVTIYENFYVEEETKEVDSTLRIFKNRSDEMDGVCIMDGEIPTKKGEIAIDRMYADNNNLKVGDTITVGKKKLDIVGLVALSDYSALFSNNSDLMFDSIKFGVAVVVPEQFEDFGDTHFHASYAWKYKNKPEDDTEAKEMSEDFLKVLTSHTIPTNYIPQYLNQAIHFTGDDMVGDNSMFTAFLYIVVAIIAFIIAITTTSTIWKEANVIGTLRASGYKRSELILHYMKLPVIVMLIAAVVGNILGYTVLKEYMAAMYYGSYSLPTYVTRWNGDAFVKTTVVPLVIMILINLLLLEQKMRMSPLRFIRRDFTKNKKKSAIRLNERIPFIQRFRMRIIFQNMPNYLMIFIGVFMANFIILFGLMMSPLLDHFSEEIVDNMICSYQYVLKTPVETEMDGAEKYCAGSLKTLEGSFKSEEVTIYGIEDDSEYIHLNIKKNEIYISSAYAEKYHLEKNDEIVLKEEYTDKEHAFEVAGIYDYPASIAVFMNQEEFWDTFDKEEGYFNGYFSDEKLTDVDEKLIATTIGKDDLTKTSRQLKVSMGNAMQLFYVFGVLMFIMIIYLLSKIIIEKNALSISMAKILGYSNKEINRLYITSTTIVTILSMLITIPLCNVLMDKICEFIFMSYPGYFAYYVPGRVFAEMFAMGVISYLVVVWFQMRKIRRIPMSEALKNVE